MEESMMKKIKKWQGKVEKYEESVSWYVPPERTRKIIRKVSRRTEKGVKESKTVMDECSVLIALEKTL